MVTRLAITMVLLSNQIRLATYLLLADVGIRVGLAYVTPLFTGTDNYYHVQTTVVLVVLLR